jgi:hypothetical protein
MESFKIPLLRVIFNRGCCGTPGNCSLEIFSCCLLPGFSQKYNAALLGECATCNRRTNMATR